MRLLPALGFLLMLASNSSAAPFLVAHRGASKDAPENTLPAFELAWKQGADAIEGDFHLTKDQRIICMHDRDTKRTAGRKLVVKQSTLAELTALDVGSWKDKAFAGTRPPTLSEVCATIPAGKRIYIEIKCGPEIVPVLLREVAASGLADGQIAIIAFDAEVIRAIKVDRPRWTANWLYSFDDKKTSDPGRSLPEVLRTLNEIKADALGSNAHPRITAAMIGQLAAAGFHHHVWTVDDEATARRFLALGTKSVTTNVPGKLREALKEG